jgi:hypothetical protein
MPEAAMKREDYCERARALIGGDRAQQHGDVRRTHESIAALWSAWLGQRGLLATEDLSAGDVLAMMALLKLARTLNGSFNADDYVDAIGYIALAGEVAEKPD